MKSLKILSILVVAGFLAVAKAEDNTAKEVKKETAKTEAKKETKSDGKKAGEKKVTTVVMDTSMGQIEIELDNEKAPLSSGNFEKYVDAKHYDGTIFHRVIDGFMIQGGGFDEKMNEKTTRAPIANEAGNGLKNKRGTIAMARTMDPNSATAQFYINVVDNAALDFRDPSPMGVGYAVFGKVTKGMDVVDKIKAVATGNKGGMQNVPNTPVIIKTIRKK